MRLFFIIASLIAFHTPGLCADPIYPSVIGTWSNREGAAGNTLSVARLRMGFDDDFKIPADYLVCNGETSPKVSFENSEKTGTVAQDIESGKCECFKQPEVLVFRNAYNVGTIVFGTFEAFAPGSGCKGRPLTISTPLSFPPSACSDAFDKNLCKMEPSSNLPVSERPYCFLRYWNAVRCPLSIPNVRANYRVCSKSNSLVKSDGSTYPVGHASLVTDSKLANHFPLNSGSQPLWEFSQLTGDCIDLYQVKQLEILIGPYPVTDALDPYSVKKVDVQIRSINE